MLQPHHSKALILFMAKVLASVNMLLVINKSCQEDKEREQELIELSDQFSYSLILSLSLSLSWYCAAEMMRDSFNFVFMWKVNVEGGREGRKQRRRRRGMCFGSINWISFPKTLPPLQPLNHLLL